MAPVSVFRDFDELLTFAENEYGNEVFLSRGLESISFSSFARRVRDIARRFVPRSVYALSIQDPIIFAHAYFSCVLSGAAAFMCSPGENANNLPPDIPILHDEDISVRFALGSARSIELYPENTCTIAFSSGTTAAGKGVMLSQKNLLMDTAYSIERYRYWRGERLLHVLPYHHLFGLIADLLAPLHAGSHVHFPSRPIQALREALIFQPNVINIPPAYADALVSIPDFGRLGAGNGGTLVKVLCSGAALSKKRANQLFQLGILPCTAYGLTECSPCVAITEDDDVRPGTVGREIGCVKLAFSEDNEILVSGETVMLGYYRNPLETNKRIRNGWLHTGDLGYRDDHGHIVVTGRSDNLLILPSGKKCSPELIEEELQAVDGICECVLLQNDTFPEGIAAVIVKRNGTSVDTASVSSMLMRHGIERFAVQYREKELPKNHLGKVMRGNVL